MKPKTCRLDGRQRSKRAVLRKLARDLGFPPHFGENLDALHDVLTTDIAGRIEISWHTTERARTALGADFERIRGTLRDAAKERGDLTLDFD